MSEVPSFNYKTVYFFWLSLFGGIFVLSLLDLIKVKNTDIFLFVSFLNIVIGVFAWIYQINLDNGYKIYTIKHERSHSELIKDFEWYSRKEVQNLIFSSFFVYGLTLAAIVAQL